MDAIVIRRLFFLILGLAYMVAGVFIYIKNILPAPWGLILLMIFTIYGSWRIYRGFNLKS